MMSCFTFPGSLFRIQIKYQGCSDNQQVNVSLNYGHNAQVGSTKMTVTNVENDGKTIKATGNQDGSILKHYQMRCSV
jgi:hypothetical protein